MSDAWRIMNNRASIYRRLPGRGTALAHYVRLYEGPDHFLQISSTGFSESYKRFYFRDIQAFIIEKKIWHHLWSAFWGAFAAAFFIPAWFASGGAAVVLWSIAGFFVGLLLLNIAIGPSCVCRVQTAVQTEKLPTLKRVRSARKFIQRIHPVLLSAQSGAAPSAQESPSESASEAPGAGSDGSVQSA
jgi:hypothetical protein